MTIKISSEEVFAHAEQVDEAREQVEQSALAARIIHSSNGAYGVFLGRLIPAVLNSHTEDVINAYDQAVQALESLTNNLRGMSVDLMEADQRSADRVEHTR